jgi:nicotinamide-nucleotide amidase
MSTTGDAAEQLAEQIGGAANDLGLSLGVSESLTGGLVVQVLAKASDSSRWLQGGIVAYARDVKRDVLGVDTDRVVSERAAVAMASGARMVLGADVAVALTGVGGPDEQDGEPPGTVWIAVDDGAQARTELHRFEGDPSEICAQARDAALVALRDRLVDQRHPIERIGA